MKLRALLILFVGILLLTACSTLATVESTQSQPVDEAPAQTTDTPATEGTATLVEESSAPFELTSVAFAYGEPIPVKYSCDGEDISPPLVWGPPPAGTKSQALIMDDRMRRLAPGIIGFLSTFPKMYMSYQRL